MNARKHTRDGTRMPLAFRIAVWPSACALLLVCLLTATQPARGQVTIRADQNIELDKPTIDWLKRYLARQIALARRCGKMTPTQSGQLSQFDPPWLIAELQPNFQSSVPKGTNQSKLVQMPTKLIDEAVASVLTDVQRRAFQTATAKTRKFRAETLADVLLVNIERKIYIEEHRRSRLREKLAAWCMHNDLQASYYLSNPTLLPKLPAAALAEILDAEQMKKLAQFSLFTFQSAFYETNMLVHEDPILIRERPEKNPHEEHSK